MTQFGMLHSLMTFGRAIFPVPNAPLTRCWAAWRARFNEAVRGYAIAQWPVVN
jgi:hypothetical protein